MRYATLPGACHGSWPSGWTNAWTCGTRNGPSRCDSEAWLELLATRIASNPPDRRRARAHGEPRHNPGSGAGAERSQCLLTHDDLLRGVLGLVHRVFAEARGPKHG